jgi:hypothetical protein
VLSGAAITLTIKTEEASRVPLQSFKVVYIVHI